jgi:hypothetical protein
MPIGHVLRHGDGPGGGDGGEDGRAGRRVEGARALDRDAGDVEIVHLAEPLLELGSDRGHRDELGRERSLEAFDRVAKAFVQNP